VQSSGVYCYNMLGTLCGAKSIHCLALRAADPGVAAERRGRAHKPLNGAVELHARVRAAAGGVAQLRLRLLYAMTDTIHRMADV